MRVLRHGVRFDAYKSLHQAQQRIVLCKAVNEVQAGIPPAHGNDAVDDVKIYVGLEDLGEILHIGIQLR